MMDYLFSDEISSKLNRLGCKILEDRCLKYGFDDFGSPGKQAILNCKIVFGRKDDELLPAHERPWVGTRLVMLNINIVAENMKISAHELKNRAIRQIIERVEEVEG